MRLDVSFCCLLDNFQQFRMLSKEEIEKMKVLLRLMTYLRPSTRWVVLSVSLLILGTLIDLTAPWLLKEVFDKGIARITPKLFCCLLYCLQAFKLLRASACSYRAARKSWWGRTSYSHCVSKCTNIFRGYRSDTMTKQRRAS